MELGQTQLNTMKQCVLGCCIGSFTARQAHMQGTQGEKKKIYNLWRCNVPLQDLSYNGLNMRVHMEALQHAQRICNKIALQGMMLNEEKNSTMAKS